MASSDYKSIRVMPDFSSSGLWDEGAGGVMIEIDDLDLPPLLKLLFIDWIDLFEESWDVGYNKMDTVKCDQLNERGLELARQLKKLYPEKRIFYWGEVSSGKLREKIELL